MRNFVLSDEKSSRDLPHAEYLEVPYTTKNTGEGAIERIPISSKKTRKQWVMSLAEKSRINLLYLICSKEIINAGRFKKSVGVRYFDKLEFDNQRVIQYRLSKCSPSTSL